MSAYFPGDGIHEPAHSDTYTAYVSAFVSLDLPIRITLRRDRPVDLRGVVRPRRSGSVQVLVREDRPGTAYWVLRYTNLVAGRSDSYYRIGWTPRTPGRYILRTRWNHGTRAPGDVIGGLSAAHYVTVS